MAGTHGIGHTRMATESAVTTNGAHPFTTGPDQCLVHKGSLSKHNAERRERFLAQREEIERIYDARFFRMWEFWFACSEISVEGAMIFQIQMSKRQGVVVPITRDYITREEARLRNVERERRPPLRVAGE